jgi:hypothetical protein
MIQAGTIVVSKLLFSKEKKGAAITAAPNPSSYSTKSINQQ